MGDDALRVALTFDAEHPDRPGCRAGVPEAIVEGLATAGVRATFFLQGRWVEAYPATAHRIAATGHLIGSHSYCHARMTLLSDAGLAADVGDAERVIWDTLRADPRPWFRCPFGDGHDDPRITAALARLGYRDVSWDVSPGDWDPDRTPAEVAESVAGGVLARGDGAVVLLHIWPDNTLAALPTVIGRLREAGATFVTVAEVLGSPMRTDRPENLIRARGGRRAAGARGWPPASPQGGGRRSGTGGRGGGRGEL